MSAAVMFGQLVIGPPGAGKSTYCAAMQQFLGELKRNVILVNLDPANDNPTNSYQYQIDIRDLISVDDAMAHFGLGPNGALVYCMDFLLENIDWLFHQLCSLDRSIKNHYLIFDLPGQVELFTHCDALPRIVAQLSKRQSPSSPELRLCCVALVDSLMCCLEPNRFVSALLLSLSSMLHLQMSHVNLLSKIDLLTNWSEQLPFSLDYFLEVQDLSQLLECFKNDDLLAQSQKYKKLSKCICDVVEEYGLVSFLPLNITEKESMLKIVGQVDKANGYWFAQMEIEQLRNELLQKQQ